MTFLKNLGMSALLMVSFAVFAILCALFLIGSTDLTGNPIYGILGILALATLVIAALETWA